MRYIPHTDSDVQGMLQQVGIERISDLFDTIPHELKLNRDLMLPAPLDEVSLTRLLDGLAQRCAGSSDRMALFLGAGAYSHHVSPAVNLILLRGEFFTAYTPYQPETSQGTLQAIFEYQSMMAEITGCDVINASMYDGASATAEAMLMALRIRKKQRRLLVSRAVHPEVRATCRTYLGARELPEEIGFTPDGRTDPATLQKALAPDVAAVVVQQPNFLGCIEDLSAIAKAVHDCGALLIVLVMEPVSLGLLAAPGTLGADIVIGEGMGLGTGLNFGGPGLGIFGCSQKNAWQLPGRLVGETTDHQGRRGYVLTMSTREQHIRRARATSNICSNESLCALAASVQLSLLGKSGFVELARSNAANAREACRRLTRSGAISRAFSSPFFNEFTLRFPPGALAIALPKLQEAGILGGLPLGRFYPELEGSLLVCVTELNTRDEVERFAIVLDKG